MNQSKTTVDSRYHKLQMSWVSNYALFPNVHFIHLVCVISLLLCIYQTCELFVRGDHIKPSSWNIDENEFTTFSM